MARKALIVKQARTLAAHSRAKEAGKKPRFSTRAYHRCALCGRRRGFMRFFDICRICFRELASNGEVPGVRKSSW